MNQNTFMQNVLRQVMNHPGEFNEITLYPHDETDIEKICKCKKCGEEFTLLLRTERQGDMKLVPVWIINETSGIKQLKENMKVCYREKYICLFGNNNLKSDVENAVSHYDDHALEELENKKCIMKDCDGELFDEYNRDELFKEVYEDYKKNQENKNNDNSNNANKDKK